MTFNSLDHPHRRYNPLTGEWILVSPHRTKRPWQGKVESIPPEERPRYDPQCYLCPGNTRANDAQNPPYENTFVFTNDFAALLPDVPPAPESDSELFRLMDVQGTCRVICFSPRHDLTLPEMEVEDIRRVVDVWAEQTTDLARNYRWVQIFENKGQMLGASNPHPHGQIWAGSWLPNEAVKENENQLLYYEEHQQPLLVDYATQESASGVRTIVENEDWIAVVPYWAMWPFEMLLVPRRHVLRLPDLTDAERDSLASVLKRLLTRYDNLFKISFPYSMGWHQAPNDNQKHEHWQLHAHFYPPLLRSATVRKFMVGYEMLAEAQRDLTPEQAAARLKELSETHYKT